MKSVQHKIGSSIWTLMVLWGTVTGVHGRNTQLSFDVAEDLIELTPSNFNSNVMESDGAWVVQFYAPWCPYCKQLAPEWIKTAENLRGQVSMGNVNCQRYPTLRNRFFIRGYPTILIFGADKTHPKPYYGERTASEMTNYFYNIGESEQTEISN